MILPAVNLLLYATISGFPQHTSAKKWWDALLSGRAEIAITSPTLFGFVRLATNRKVFDPPMDVGDAIDRIESWLSRPQVRFLQPGPLHLEIAATLLRHLGTAGNLTTDVQLAALAIEYHAELHSNDSDFGRFPRLRWVNPLG